MTDKELLKLAAKAYWGNEIDDVCSISWDEFDQCIAYTHADNQDHNGQDRTFLWNPLTDDGDALRLAVKLKMDVILDFDRVVVCFGASDEFVTEYFYVLPEPTDIYAATRRAIVRAVAEIGKNN